MAKDQIYSSVIRLNTEDAQNKMEDLKRKVQDLVALRDTIDKKKDSGYYKEVSRQISKAKAELKVYENEVMKTIQTLDNLGNASAKDIRDAQKALQKMIDAKPQNAEEMGDFVRRLQEVKQELQSIATMRAFEEVKAGITGTGKSAHQLGAEMRFLRKTSENVGTASIQQLEKALDVAREHLRVANQGTKAYERSTEYIRVFSGQIETIKEKQKQSNTLIDRYNKELREAGQESKVVTDEIKLIEQTLDNLGNASIVDLEYSIKALNEEMRHMDRSSDEYREAEKKVKRLRTELEQTRRETGAQQSAWGKFIGFFNRNWGVITQAIGAVTGLSMTIRRAVQDFAEMEEEMADVRKYTGLTADQVRDLNEALKKMDTRTSREELNQLAGAAGRLGISAKDDILEFVDAADKIKVALGDDLGEGAVDQIGKLAMSFGEDEKKGLRGAMLATGSAVNELAQNSSAKAGYLVDFTARVAGFGKQLGLTQAQLMGFGAVMDENLLRDEMAATAFGNMLTKMQTDTAKFARIAGKDVKEFTDLLNRDANAAVLALADSLRSADPQTMMKMLDGMGLDGSRAVAVIATLADKIDDVRQHQERATKAYEEGTSVSKEFETMNNTVQARLDKVKKRFHEMTVELGEKLLPVVSLTISGAGMMAKGLSALLTVVENYRATIISLTVTLTALVAIKEKDILMDKLKVFWNDKVVASTKKLFSLISKHPYAALAVGIAAVVGWLIDMKRRTDAVTEAVKEANESVSDETARLRVLENTLNYSNASEEDRRKALEEINGKLMEAHLGNITEEEVRLGKLKGKLDEYIRSLRDKITLQRLEAKLSQAITEEQEATDDIDETSFWKNLSGQNYRNFNKRNRARKTQEQIMQKIDEYNRRNAPLEGNTIDEVVVTYNPRAKGGNHVSESDSGSGSGSGAKKDPYEEDQKLLDSAFKNRQLLLKKQQADGLLSERQYHDKSFNLEMEHLADLIRLQQKYGKDTADTQMEILDKTMQQTVDMQQRSAQAMQEELNTAEDAYNTDRLELARQRNEGVIATDKEYQQRLKEQELDYLQQRLAIIRRFGGDTLQAEQAIEDRQLQDVKEFQNQMKQAYEKAYSQADTLDDQRMYARMMYDQQLIDFEDYQQRMTDIEEREQQHRADVRQQFFQMGQQLLSAYSAYAQACSDLETAKITADYDRQIEAAGKNSRKRERLEKERDEKLRKAKTKSNERAMRIEIAQALATTAANALAAYGAVLQPQMPWTVPLAYAAAAAATVNGMLQVATIKKQHQAEAAGYYEGGFTGGRRYRREAGVVHEGEFVANHQAVNNPAIVPFLNFLDQAQKNNTVGSLSAKDVSRQLGTGNTSVVTPIVNVQTDNEQLNGTLARVNDAIVMLNQQLLDGINANVIIDGPQGFHKQYSQYLKLNDRV